MKVLGNGNLSVLKFNREYCTVYKLFDSVFGEAQMVQWNGKSKETKALRKKKSLHIKRLIVSYLRCIILKLLLVFISFDISVIFIVYLQVD